jgi:hypothetical protein
MADPHAVHLLIELLPNPEAVEMLKTWSKGVLEIEEETDTVLWYVQANPPPLRLGRAGVDEMLERWKAEGASRHSAGARG